MTTSAEDIRIAIIDMAKEKLGITISVSINKNTFGTSMYIQNECYGKIRISDHSVTSTDRIWNERHYTLSKVADQMDYLMKDIEEIFFPERFVRVKKQIVETNISTDLFKSIGEFRNRMPRASIVRAESIKTTKGKSRLSITFSYPVKAIVERIERI